MATTKKARPASTGANVELDADVRPYEDQPEREGRIRRETVEEGDRIMAAGRERDDRARAALAAAPRRQALRSMWQATIGMRGHLDHRARRKALEAHPVYASLPKARQAEWLQFLDAAAAAERTGDFTGLWRALDATASVQADHLGEWDPPTDAVAESPAELARLVPR